MSRNVDELFDSLLEELENDRTSSERIDQIASEHIKHNFICEICKCFSEHDEMLGTKISGHANCSEKTLDKLIDWGTGRGDPGWEVDILLSACSRKNFTGKWLDHVLDTAWIYRLQFENNLHFRFISNLMHSRELSEEERDRIKEANDMDFNGEIFPTREDLDRMGL